MNNLLIMQVHQRFKYPSNNFGLPLVDLIVGAGYLEFVSNELFEGLPGAVLHGDVQDLEGEFAVVLAAAGFLVV
jgi:hypothetical protein